MFPVLACVDLSENTPTVIERARELTSGLSRELVLLHVVAPDPEFVGYKPGPQSARDAVAAHIRDEHREVQHLAEPLRASGLAVTPLTVQGPSAEKILELAKKTQASYIVVGSHNHGPLYDLFVGSVAREVLKHSTIPVLVVPAPRQ